MFWAIFKSNKWHNKISHSRLMILIKGPMCRNFSHLALRSYIATLSRHALFSDDAGLLLFSISFFLFLKFGFWICVVLNVSFFKLARAGKRRYPLAAPVSLSCESENAKGGAVPHVCPLPANVFQDAAWIWSVYPSSCKCKMSSQ